MRRMGTVPSGRLGPFGFRIAELAMPDTVSIFPGAVATRYHLGCGRSVIPGYLVIDEAREPIS